MDKRPLSSAQTFIMKFVFPAIWICAFGAGTLALWSGEMHGRNGLQPPAQMKWLFLCGWLAGSASILRFCAPLKRVRLDGTILRISNYRHEIAVPLNSVDRVSENRWINIHPVTIHFRRATEFGDAITFMPTARLFGFWSAHPVVAELEQAVFAQRVRSRLD